MSDFLWQHRDKRITINEAYALLQKSQPGIGKATIYRMYHLLMELGFAQRLEVGDGLFRYEIHSQNSVHTSIISSALSTVLCRMYGRICWMKWSGRSRKSTVLQWRITGAVFGCCNSCKTGKHGSKQM